MAENLINEFKIYLSRLQERIEISSLGIKLGKGFQAALILATVLFLCYLFLFVYV